MSCEDRSFSAPAVASVAVDERAAAALRGDLAADEQLLAAVLEDRLDRGGFLAGPDEVARGASAEEQIRRLRRESTCRRRFRPSGR